MSHPEMGSAGVDQTTTIGVMAVISDKDEDVSLVYRFVDRLTPRQSKGAAEEMRKMAEKLDAMSDLRPS